MRATVKLRIKTDERHEKETWQEHAWNRFATVTCYSFNGLNTLREPSADGLIYTDNPDYHPYSVYVREFKHIEDLI